MADVIIIGSGFGGSIAAARFTEAGYTVALYELGEWFTTLGGSNPNIHTPSGTSSVMQQTQDLKYLFRLFRDYPTNYLQSKPNVIVTQGMGVGGGSNVYAGIHLRAPTTALSTTNNWPSGYTRANLDPYYTRVENKLAVVANPGGTYTDPHPSTLYPNLTWPTQTTLTDSARAPYPITGNGSFPRTNLFASGAAAAGLPAAQPLPLAITNCAFCGWCVPNCVLSRKNNMYNTYLARALATGRLTIYTNRKAIMVTKPTSSTYRVHFWDTSTVTSNYHRVTGPTSGDNNITADAARVVIACGSIESPALLWRSMWRSVPSGTSRIAEVDPNCSGWPYYTRPNLGTAIDGQGDSAAGGFLPGSNNSNTYKGAIMMAYVDMGNYIITDVHAFPVAPGVKYPAAFPSVMGGPMGERLWGLNYKRKWKRYGTNMLGMGIIGQSPSGANLSVSVSNSSDDSTHNGDSNALLSTGSYSPPTGGVAAARSIVTALGGELADTPWEKYNSGGNNNNNGNVTQQIGSVHPTGGCRMGKIVAQTNLQVNGNANLFVIDGSVFPASCFRNPSHTISAIAEKAMDVILGVPGAPTW